MSKEFEKILKDRLNHLKSNLADARHPKLTKVLMEDTILELEIRIDEIEYLINQNRDE